MPWLHTKAISSDFGFIFAVLDPHPHGLTLEDMSNLLPALSVPDWVIGKGMTISI